MNPQLEQLLRDYDGGLRPKYLFFWGHTPPANGHVGPHVLSQWWVSPFSVDGHTYQTAEHWMMAAKARLFNDAEMLAQILAVESPAAAKKLGRKVRNFDARAWDNIKFGAVVAGNVHKFGTNPILREYLLGTQNRVLVEASPMDRIWGIGLGKNNPTIENPHNWRGQNLLGFALMEARQQLANTNETSINTVSESSG